MSDLLKLSIPNLLALYMQTMVDFWKRSAPKLMRFMRLVSFFSFAAASEAQFLNMLEEKIVFETTGLLDAEMNMNSFQTTINNWTLRIFWSSKRLLDEHLRRLKETRASIENSGGPRWPRATKDETDVYAKVKTTRDMLLRDYDYLLERTETLSGSCARGMDVAGNNALVAESRSAIQQADWVAKLTLTGVLLHPSIVYHFRVRYEFRSVRPRDTEFLDMACRVSTYLHNFAVCAIF